jgi:hypothetical protein
LLRSDGAAAEDKHTSKGSNKLLGSSLV